MLLFLLTRDLTFASTSTSRLGEADLRIAARILGDADTPWVDWTGPELLPITRTAAAAAHFAELLAANIEAVEPATAWTAAWLAFAPWLAVGIVEPAAVIAWPADDDPQAAQKRQWGASRADVAWNLANEWPLPAWARVLLARLDATPAEAHEFGGDRRLQALVQVAIVLAEQAETRLYVADDFDLSAALAELHLRSADLDRVRAAYAADVVLDNWLDRPWTDPRSVPGLAAKLARAADRLQQEFDDDLETVQVDINSDRIQAAKLAAVAEFAAGASHEINNPLAVISGQSQYLLRQEADDARREALESIIRQTRRIHAALSELMYFARPPVPRLELVDLVHLVRESAAGVASLAAGRGVEIEQARLTGPFWVQVDPKLLIVALTALIRNGVEAAVPGGWVRVSAALRPDRLEVLVEDNGMAPDARSREHMFDPFFSGRAAGRGRGLGLSAAWRLAKEHGGDVRFVPLSEGPTRFVLSLPVPLAAASAQRKSA